MTETRVDKVSQDNLSSRKKGKTGLKLRERMILVLLAGLLIFALLGPSSVEAATYDYIEDFTTTTFQDAANTNTTGWGTGEIRLPRSNPLLVGGYDTAGDARGIALAGGFAFIADGSAGLQVVNISDPAQPTLAGSFDTSGEATGVSVWGNLAYVADGASGLQVINITNPTHPTFEASMDTPDSAVNVWVEGDIAYVVDYPTGLVSVNISNPSLPTWIGEYATPGEALNLYIEGNYAFIADNASGLAVVDITNPRDPVLAGTCSIPQQASGVWIAGDHAYIADGEYGLQILSIMNPRNPTLVGAYDTADSAWTVAVEGDYAYLANGLAGIIALNVTFPFHPAWAGVCDTDGTAKDVAIAGNFAYVADGKSGLQVIKVSDPVDPTWVGHIDTLDMTRGIFVSGDYAYTNEWYSGVRVLNISNPSSPVTLGTYNTPRESQGLKVAGDYIYVANGNAGLTIINATDPTHLTRAGGVGTPDCSMNLDVEGNFAYMADRDSGLQVINVTDPRSPRIVGSYNTPGRAYDVDVEGNYAYVADVGGDLRIFDVTDPTQPTFLTHCDTPNPPYSAGALSLFVEGNYVYVGLGGAGLAVVNITDPAHPTVVGYLEMPGDALDVFVSGSYAYVATGYVGVLQIIDIADPSNPTMAWQVTVPGQNEDVFVSGDYAYVASLLNGLQVVEIRHNRWRQYESMACGQSLAVFDSPTATIERATLTCSDEISSDTDITYYLSTDEGTNWESVTPGIEHNFAQVGHQLVWRANLQTVNWSNTPVLSMLVISYYAQLDPPSLNSPLDEAMLNDDTPTFEWSEIYGAVEYLLQLDRASTFDTTDLINFTVASSTTYTPLSSLSEGLWYWRVFANDSQGELSDPSSVWSFSIDVTPPTWDFQPVDQTVEFGDPFSYDIGASDGSGIDHYWVNDTLFSISSDGLITNATDLAVGVVWLEVRAYDPYDNFCTATFKVTVQDTTIPTWDEAPGNHHFEDSIPFAYDVNATDLAGIDHYWVNDTTFAVDIDGLITNVTDLVPNVYWLEIRAYDPSDNYCTATIRIEVEALAPPEWIEEPTDQIVEFGDSFHYNLNATDLSGLDSWWLNDTTMFTIDVEGIITDLVSLPVGKYGLKVWVNDTLGLTLMTTFTVTVQDTTPPSWIGIPSNKLVLSWRDFIYDLNAQDLSGLDTWWINDTVNFAIDGDGVITNATFLHGGLYGLRVFVNDTYNNILDANFTVDVRWCPNPPIVIEADEDFDNQGWPGTGTEDDPFIIQNQIIDLQGTGGYCISIANTRAHFKIYNCSLSGTIGTQAAIYLYNVSNAIIIGNTIVDNYYGIHLSNSSYCIITSNNCTAYSHAFYFRDVSQFNTISHNYITSDSGAGIYFYYAAFNTIYNNTIPAAYYAVYAYYASHTTAILNNCTSIFYFRYSSYSLASQNDITGSLTFYYSESSIVTNNSAYSISITYSHFSTISNNTIQLMSISQSTYCRISDNDCLRGFINLNYCNFNIIINNNCSGSTGIALQLYGSSSCIVANNTFHDNYGQAIYLVHSYNITVTNNTCIDNGNGIYIYDYYETDGQHTIIWNVFANNTQDAYTDQNHGSVFSHNYYSQYTGIVDENNDGVGETPYTIPGYGSLPVDHYPLMLPPGAAPIWLMPPIDQIADYSYVFAYDIDATAYYPGIEAWWLNDTTNFVIDQYGLVTNSTFLPLGFRYGLTVYARDTNGYVISAEFSIQVEDNLPPEWVISPGNQRLELGEDLYYDLDAYDPSGIDLWWVSDTDNFTIDQNGVITNVKPLTKRLYPIQVSVNDTFGHVTTASFIVAVDMYIPHSPIYIYGDAAFESQGWPGSGTPTDPYRIEYLEISAAYYDDCIYIRDTNAHFVIRDCLLSGGYTGIYIVNAANGQLINNTCVFNGYGYGIEISSSSSILIANGNCSNNEYGVYLYSCSDIVITDSIVSGNGYYGLYLHSCSDIVITDSIVSGNDYYGLYLYSCSDIVITDNIVSANGNYGFYLSSCSGIVITDSTVSGNGGVGFDLYSCSGFVITDSTISGNRNYGFNLHSCSGIVIIESVVSANGNYGVYSSHSSNSIFRNNTITDSRYGIYLYNSEYNTLTNNSIVNNRDYGIYLWYSDHSILTWNIFGNSTTNVYDRSSYNTFDYNFYSDYTGIDADKDSIGDTPHTFYNNQDPHPRMMPRWLTHPADQILEFGDVFQYEFNVQYFWNLHTWWLNDSTYFSIDNNGVITSIGLVPVGSYGLTVSVNDTRGAIVSGEFTITVVDTTPPSWVETPITQTSEFGTSFIYDLNAFDLSVIDYWWLNITEGFVIDENGVITNSTFLAVGVYSLEVRVYDIYDNYRSAEFCVLVVDTTNPVWVQTPSDRTVELGESFSYELFAYDLSGLHNWWINDTARFIIEANGVITNATWLEVGEYWIEVRAFDPYGNYAGATFRVIVQDTTPPSWIAVPTDQMREFGEAFLYELEASDLSELGSWSVENGLFVIDWAGRIRSVSMLNPGMYGVTVHVADIYGNTLTARFTVTVVDTTPPQWGASLHDQTLGYGERLSYQLVATDLSGLDSWWLNDTINFKIDAFGLVTDVALLDEGSYGLKVWVNDTHGNLQWGVFRVEALAQESIVTQLDLQLSGNFDFLLEEKINLQLAAFLRDAATGYPLSGASITATIYGPAFNDKGDKYSDDERFVMNVTLVEEVPGSGVYIFTAEETMKDMSLEKGIYVVYCSAIWGDLQTTEMIQFHIDPPGESGSSSDSLLIISSSLIGVLSLVSLIIIFVKRRKHG